MTKQGDRWSKLRPELDRMQGHGQPVTTLNRHIGNTIEHVGADYVVVRSEEGRQKPRLILAQDINAMPYKGNSRIVLALQALADSLP